MKQKLRLGSYYALTKHKLKQFKIRYISLLAALTIMCLYARAQRPEPSGPALSGIVTDTTGTAIRGATITIRGTNTKAITERNGRFSIHAPKGSGTLVVSYLGHQTINEPFDGRAGEFRFVLIPTENMLEEVEVSTGYQTIPKERATGSFDFIDNKLFNRMPGRDIVSRLEGIAVGVDFVKQTNSFQYYSARAAPIGQMSIRGISTLYSAKQPLVVVDNFAYDGNIHDLNPNDVESVTLLKDAAASSIWGARAGNGVIVVKTKKGKLDQPLRVSLNSNVAAVEKPDLFYLPDLTPSEHIDVELDLFDRGHYDSRINNTSTFPWMTPVLEILASQREGKISDAEAKARIDQLRTHDVRNDFLRYVYRTQINQQYALNISGGSTKHSFRAAAGYDAEMSRIQVGGLKRFTVKMDHMFQPIDRLQVRASVFYVQNRVSDVGDAFYPEYNRYRVETGYQYARLVDDAGNPAVAEWGRRSSYLDTLAGGRLLDWKYRPLDELQHSRYSGKGSNVVFNIETDYTLIPSLKASVQYRYERGEQNNFKYYDQESFFTRNQINTFTHLEGGELVRAIPLGGLMIDFSNYTYANQLRTQLDFNKSFALHSISAIAGWEVRDRVSSENGATKYGYDEELLTYKPVDFQNFYRYFHGGSGIIPDYVQLRGYQNRYLSYFFNAAYSFAQHATFSVSARKDASNIFGANKNQAGTPLWSVGGSWNIHKADFYNLDWLPQLKLRTTFGYSGNMYSSISAFPTISYASSVNSVTKQGYASIGTPPNPDLGWEKSEIWNIGLDFATKQRRIHGSLEYYRRTSTDVIAQGPIDPTTGFLNLRYNSANLLSKGIDLSIGASPVKTSAFEWNTTANIAYSRSVVTDYLFKMNRSRDYVPNATSTNPLEGKDVNAVFAYRWGGLDAETGAPLGIIDGEKTDNYTQIVNAPVESAAFMGSSLPLYFGSWRNAITYRNISLSFNMLFRLKYYFRRESLNYYNLVNYRVGHPDFQNRWQRPGDELHTQVPAFIYPVNSNRDEFYNYSEINVGRADHIRLQDISLSYSLTTKTMLRRIRLYATAQNLGVIWRANNWNLEPDTGSGTPLPLVTTFGFSADF
ncbi:MAG TPA: SusC/RagA family TonB-linked outer membrane protein [Parapedobacter sp.]|uniref:SusC/RagA family TonB-linked outer membrane protein n=1 Tax=Parapedobacter sp. TaxID=1958893 RepID=UPI002BF42A99|nr:SusC/RagA family TonB-linked outer membrane protein [Parapedobacter sp.]HWK57305.1 SusC/RagA family TonB-linked outer membrane protein [Parapedobacter sp.]